MVIPSFLLRFLLAAAILVAGRELRAEENSTAQIVDIYADGSELVVVAEVPPGYKKITLESRRRLDRKTWEPRAVRRIDGAGGEIIFRIPYSERLEVLRVKAEAADLLPSVFFSGSSTFNASASLGTTGGTTSGTTGASTGTTAGTTGSTDGTSGGATTGTTSGTTGSTGATTGGPITHDEQPAAPEVVVGPRTVVESDIWKLGLNRIYFFNQTRGLQIIDTTSPASPVLKATLDLPAVGEQMYLLADGRIVLLARLTACPEAPGRVIVVKLTNDQPLIESEFVLKGSILESRAVGGILYVAANEYRRQDARWEQGTALYSFNFGSTGAPVRHEFWSAIPSQVVTATDKYFFLYQQSWVTETNGPVTVATLTLNHQGDWAGNLETYFLNGDRFTLDTGGEPSRGRFVLTSLTDRMEFVATFDQPTWMAGFQDRLTLMGPNPGFGTGTGSFNGTLGTDGPPMPVQGTYTFQTQGTSTRMKHLLHYIDISSDDGSMSPGGEIELTGRVADKFKIHLQDDLLAVVSAESSYSSVKTFSLANPALPVALGNLAFAHGEQLFATRFHGDKVYVVTFRRTDPLWVIDLSDPAQPAISGELIIPGWSTFIQPLPEGRLLSVGIGDNFGTRLAVQLFDVSNPANPRLLDKEWLGQTSSHGEVSRDEKAFQYFAEQNLILVPYEENGSSAVQLLDLTGTNLTLRGKINHDFTARRAAYLGNHVLSVSSRELLSVNVANRDQPELKTALELTWGVDQLFVVGEYLIELDHPQSVGTSPIVRLVHGDQPHQVLSMITLTNWNFGGSIQRGDTVFLAQYLNSWPYSIDWPVLSWYENGAIQKVTNPPTVKTIQLKIANEQLVVNEAFATVPPVLDGSVFEGTFPDPDLLVWRSVGGNAWGSTTGGVGTTAGTTGGGIFDPGIPVWTTGGSSGSTAGSTGAGVSIPSNLEGLTLQIVLSSGPFSGSTYNCQFQNGRFQIVAGAEGSGTYTYSPAPSSGVLIMNYQLPQMAEQVDHFTLQFVGSSSAILAGTSALSGTVHAGISGTMRIIAAGTTGGTTGATTSGTAGGTGGTTGGTTGAGTSGLSSGTAASWGASATTGSTSGTTGGGTAGTTGGGGVSIPASFEGLSFRTVITSGLFNGSSYDCHFQNGRFVITNGAEGTGTYTYSPAASGPVLIMNYDFAPAAGDVDNFTMQFETSWSAALSGSQTVSGRVYEGITGRMTLLTDGTTGGSTGGTTGASGGTTGSSSGTTSGTTGGTTTSGVTGGTGGTTGTTTGGITGSTTTGSTGSTGSPGEPTLQISPRLIAFRVSPELRCVSDTAFAHNGWFDFSRPFATNGLVLFSAVESYNIITGTNQYVYDEYVATYVTNVTQHTQITYVQEPGYITNINETFRIGYETNVITETNIVERELSRSVWRVAPAAFPTPVVKIAAGSRHSLALTAGGQVFAWGQNIYSQLGFEGSGTSLPRLVTELGGATDIAGGTGHSLAVTASGEVFAWGANFAFQLGGPTTNANPNEPPPIQPDRARPQAIAQLAGVSEVKASQLGALSLSASGEIHRWGQLWHSMQTPTPLNFSRPIREVSAGTTFAIAVDDQGGLYGIGGNSAGQINTSSTTTFLNPVLLLANSRAVQLASGANHTLLLNEDREVFSWGQNLNGQLGHGDASARGPMLKVSALPAIAQVSAGLAHSVALDQNGEVWTWGGNQNNQLGRLVWRLNETPAKVPGIANITQVAAGGGFTLALAADGSIFGWGDNRDGQLGANLITSETNVVVLEEISRVTNITAVKLDVQWVTNITTYLKPVPVTNFVSLTNIVLHYVPERRTNSYTVFEIRYKTQLHVTDFADPAFPAIRRAVDLPAKLVGTDYAAQILYTAGAEWTENGGLAAASLLTALAYDGAEAFRVDALALKHPLATMYNATGGFIYLAESDGTNVVTRAIQLHSDGKLRVAQTVGESGETPLLWVDARHYLALKDDVVSIYEITPQITLVGQAVPPACMVPGYTNSRVDGRNIYIPLGGYGKFHAELSANPAP